jgi:Trk K+ transport system NAD-binding subunit
VNDPKNEIVFKALGIDETISSTRVIMNVIEQELPSGGFMPLMPLTGSHLELIEAEIAAGTPAAGRAIGSLGLPDGAAVGGIVRKGIVVHADDDTKLQVGDRIVVLSPTKDEAGVRKALFG